MSRPIGFVGPPIVVVQALRPPAPRTTSSPRPTVAEAFRQPHLHLDIVTTPPRWPTWLPPAVARDLERPFSPGTTLRVLPSGERRINIWISANDDGTEIEFLRYLPEDPEHYAKRFPNEPDRARRLRAAAVSWNRDVRILVEEQDLRPSAAVRLTKQIHDDVFRSMVAAAGLAFGAAISVSRAAAGGLAGRGRPSKRMPRPGTYVPSATEAKTLLGTSDKVGDFTGIRGKSVAEVVRRIPKDATRKELRPMPGKVMDGFQYRWKANGKTYTVRVHGLDASRKASENSGGGWIVRIAQGKRYYDDTGRLHPRNVHNPNSRKHNDEAANATHIPLAGNRHARSSP